MKALGLYAPPSPPLSKTLRKFLTNSLFRPLHMLLTEPIVAFLCLYIAFNFGTLFMFFGAFFYVFATVYSFTLTQSGLVFFAIAFGCVLGTATVLVSDALLYRPRVHGCPPNEIPPPPEYRLYPAMLGSLGLLVSLFSFGWAARPDVSAAVPIIAVALFGWGNLIMTVGAIQYLGDTYHRTNVASAAAASSFARYTFGAVFPFSSMKSELCP